MGSQFTNWRTDLKTCLALWAGSTKNWAWSHDKELIASTALFNYPQVSKQLSCKQSGYKSELTKRNLKLIMSEIKQNISQKHCKILANWFKYTCNTLVNELACKVTGDCPSAFVIYSRKPVSWSMTLPTLSSSCISFAIPSFGFTKKYADNVYVPQLKALTSIIRQLNFVQSNSTVNCVYLGQKIRLKRLVTLSRI